MRRSLPFVMFVALSAAQDASGWWVLAYEGELKGRGSALTREHFDQVLANFKRYGRAVPVTLYHADIDAAAHPDSRKAHAWLDELRVGSMQVAGKTVATLEGKRRWVNDGTKADVETGAIVGGSVTIFFNWKDDATAEKLGAYLYSFSLTNNPALTHLPALAASQGVALGHWYGDITKRDDVLAMLREVFDLPVMATEEATLAELDKLERLVAAPESASGVDLDDILCAFRRALRLTALTTPAEVIDAVRQALITLPAGTPAAMSQRGAAAPNPESITMSKLIALAALFGTAAKTEDEASVAIDERIRENLNVRRALNLTAVAPAGDVAGALSALTTEAAKVPALALKVEAFEKREAAALEVMRKGYIDDVMAASALPASVRPSLELHAAQDWPGFQKAHPRPSREELAQRAQDGARLGRAALSTAVRSPAPMTGDGAEEPDADELDAAVTALMAEHGVDYATALDMLGDEQLAG